MSKIYSKVFSGQSWPSHHSNRITAHNTPPATYCIHSTLDSLHQAPITAGWAEGRAEIKRLLHRHLCTYKSVMCIHTRRWEHGAISTKSQETLTRVTVGMVLSSRGEFSNYFKCCCWQELKLDCKHRSRAFYHYSTELNYRGRTRIYYCRNGNLSI